MKYLFVTYCFGSFQGQTLIGVYKRGLRVAMALRERGHEITFFCTGREGYQDALTRAAETRLTFVDIPFSVAAFEAAEENRQRFLRHLAQIAPDILVIGEAPLAGSMLEAALCGVELGIPVAILDNAYNPYFVDNFCRTIGPLADAVILTGPSSFHSPTPPSYLCQVPERLGVSLAGELAGPEVGLLFCARDPQRCREQLDGLPDGVRDRVRVIAQPEDAELFGLLELSRLAVVKYGFMQVSECLTLQTPVLVVYHEGPTWLEALPDHCQPFLWVTDTTEASADTVAAARHLLGLSPTAMAPIHTGGLQAAAEAASFLERVALIPRTGTGHECAALGMTHDRLLQAVQARFPDAAITIETWRALRLRVTAEGDLFLVLVVLRFPGGQRVERFWARTYQGREAAETDHAEALAGAGGRRLWYYDPVGNILFEEALGEAALPPLNP